VDLFSEATCHVSGPLGELAIKGKLLRSSWGTTANERTMVATECVSEHGKAQCHELNGKCVTERDGYYIVSGICMAFGVAFLLGYIIPTARRLQTLPTSVWRVKM
jgi:MFS transporter, PAT family, solute carrier family 33 (acetyl-CoA transportor), member 1